MAEFPELLTRATHEATFSGSTGSAISPSELKDVYLQSPTPERLLNVFAMKPQIRGVALRELEASLSTLLDPYTRDGRVHGGLRRLLGGQHVVHSLLADLAPDLVRASAILGSAEVAQLLLGWISGEPLRYRVSGVFVGVRVEDELVMEDGKIKLMALPASSSELAEHLPSGSELLFGSTPFVGATKVSISCEARPALFDANGKDPRLQRRSPFGPTDSGGLSELCIGLSLVLDCYVSCVMWWNDCDDLRLCDPQRVPLGRALDGAPMDPTTYIALARTLEGSQLPRVAAVIQQLSQVHGSESVSVATQRWMRSKSWFKSQDESGSMADPFIDLRVALEALFGTSERGEYRFKVPLHGAWYVGADYEQRREVREALVKAYDLGSSAAHGSRVDATRDNRRVLAAAEKWAREGILKRLKEGAKPKWKDVVLGPPSD